MKKVLSLLLSVVMLASLFPITAMAETDVTLTLGNGATPIVVSAGGTVDIPVKVTPTTGSLIYSFGAKISNVANLFAVKKFEVNNTVYQYDPQNEENANLVWTRNSNANPPTFDFASTYGMRFSDTNTDGTIITIVLNIADASTVYNGTYDVTIDVDQVKGTGNADLSYTVIPAKITVTGGLDPALTKVALYTNSGSEYNVETAMTETWPTNKAVTVDGTNDVVFYAKGFAEDAASNKDMTGETKWSTDAGAANLTVGAVNEDGYVPITIKAKAAAGTYTVTAENGSTTKSLSFDVSHSSVAASEIEVSGTGFAESTLRLDGEATLSVKVKDQYGDYMNEPGLTATVAGSSVTPEAVTDSSVTTYTVTVPKTTADNAQIVLTSGSASTTVTVSREAPRAASVEITGDTVTATRLPSGSKDTAVTAAVLDQFGDPFAGATVTWGVTLNGAATDKVTIATGSATDDSGAATATVTVASDAADTAAGTSYTLTATVSNVTDVTDTATLSVVSIEFTGGSAAVTAATAAQTYGKTWSDLITSVAASGISASVGGSAYELTSGSYTLKITKSGGTVATFDINGTAIAAQSDGVAANAIPGAGEYTYQLVYTDATYTSGVDVTGANGTLTVSPKQLTAGDLALKSDTSTERPYDGTTASSAGLQVVSTALVGSDEVTVSAAAAYDSAAAGESKTITFSELSLGGTAAANYALASNISKTLSGKIIKVAVSATALADVAAQTYSAEAKTPEPVITWDAGAVSGYLPVEGTDYQYIYTNNTDAGTATVNIVGLENGNYTVTGLATAKNFTIAPYAVAVTWGSAENRAYTGTAFATPTATAAGLGSDGTISFTAVMSTPNGGEFKDAGEYTFTASSNSEGSSKNYTPTDATATQTVTVSPVTLDKSAIKSVGFSADKTYDGETAGATGVTVTFNGVNSETPAATANVTWSAATAGTNTFSLGDWGALSSSNYVLSATANEFTGISQIKEGTTNYSIVQAAYAASNLNTSVSVPTVNATTKTLAATALSVSGGTTVSANAGLAAGFKFKSTTPVVAHTTQVGATSGLVSGATIDADGSTLTITTNSGAQKDDASTITVEVESTNYAFTEMVTITVTAVDITYDWPDTLTSWVQTGKTFGATNAELITIPVDYQSGQSSTDGNGSTHTGTITVKSASDVQTVGSNTVTLIYTVTDGSDYNGVTVESAPISVTIAPRPVSLTWTKAASDQSSWTLENNDYDGNAHTVTAAVSNAVEGHPVTVATYTGATNMATNAGSYTATAETLSDSTNYTLTGATGNDYAWSIAKVTLTLSATGEAGKVTVTGMAGKTYDKTTAVTGSTPSIKIAGIGTDTALNATGTVLWSAAAAGTNTVDLTSVALSDNTNYTLANTSVSGVSAISSEPTVVSITKASRDLTATSTLNVYPGMTSDNTLTVTYKDLDGNAVLTATQEPLGTIRLSGGKTSTNGTDLHLYGDAGH